MMTSTTLVPAWEGVKDHAFEDANKFLNALSPRHKGWTGDPLGWIFRGHADATWKLQSKAARTTDEGTPDVFEAFGVAGAASDLSSSEKQDVLLDLFKTGLNRAGLVIPAPAPFVPTPNQLTHPGAEPERSALPLMALAQHHGLPTILLDWTRWGWVAAYFAAVEAAKLAKTKPDSLRTHLAVWALYRAGFPPDPRTAIFYEAPGGTNPNLNAQAGLFTIHDAEDNASLDVYLNRARADLKVPFPQRILLPLTEARKLLRMLAYEGVTGATMFPGADGVVQSMRERALWDQ